MSICLKLKEWLCSNCKKRNKNNLRVKATRHADLQILTKTTSKFQKALAKTVGGDWIEFVMNRRTDGCIGKNMYPDPDRG